VRQYPHALAERLLEEAGVKRQRDGSRFSIRFSYAGTQQRLALALREQLKQAGITLVLDAMDSTPRSVARGFQP
jgi:ABC-type transport system substrate-binding protein